MVFVVNMKLNLRLSLMFVPLSLLSCKPSESVDPPELPSDDPAEITLNDDGKELQIRVGQDFSISLPENRSTGYQWQLDSGELLGVKSDGYVAETSELGAGGMREYALTAEAVGETTIKAVYIRPWEKGMKPMQSFEMNVIVEQ